MTPAILVLSPGGRETAATLRAVLPGAEVLGLAGRVDGGVDRAFDEMTATVQALFRAGRPIVGLCAAGILIRMIAPLLGEKRAEPPVLAVSEDGAVVVPLIGGLTGANDMAETIAAALGVVPAITGSGARKFGVILERPPAGWRCANPDDAKGVTADLLGGAAARIEGELPWLAGTRVPLDPAGAVVLRASIRRELPPERGLLYRPRSVVAAVSGPGADVAAALDRADVDPACLAAIVAAPDTGFPSTLDAPARVTAAGVPSEIALQAAGPGATLLAATLLGDGEVALAAAPFPVDPEAIGRPRGRVDVVGLGPGADEWLTPEAHAALEDATDIVGYATYVAMVPPALRGGRVLHGSDNRVELERARAAMDLAAAGRRVAIVSSGDPGIFAMAAALMEAIETPQPGWASVAIGILPGISAMQAAAARAGAPLGHDFAVISLSDNLKPWPLILRRLEAALAADLVLALYNPVSRGRPIQLLDAMAMVGRHRGPATPVTLGRDVGRPGERVATIELAAFEPAMVDSRTVILVGSSRTRTVTLGGHAFVYTPRSHPGP